jgi:hypothetical protein
MAQLKLTENTRNVLDAYSLIKQAITHSSEQGFGGIKNFLRRLQGEGIRKGRL